MRSNVRWVLLGNVVYAAGQWVQLAILARLGGPAAVGTYAFALALTAPVMAFSSLNARALQATDARGDHTFREYRRLRSVTTVAATLGIGLMAAGTGYAGSWPVLLAVCAMRAADLLSDTYHGEWQRHERMRVNAFALALNSISSALFMIVSLMLGGGVLGAVAGAALGSCAALAFIHVCTVLDRDMRSSVGPHAHPVRWRHVGKLAVEAAPLGVIVLLNALQPNVPRYFVEHHGGMEALGLFAATNQLTSAGTIVVSALTAAAVPRLAALCAAGDARRFRALSRKLMLLGGGLGVASVGLSWLVGREVLALLYRPEFAAGSRMLVVLSVAAGTGFVASILGSALTAARVIAFQPVLLSATLVVLAASCAALVPRHGAMGAAWAMVVASAVQALASHVALRCFRPRISDRERAVDRASNLPVASTASLAPGHLGLGHGADRLTP